MNGSRHYNSGGHEKGETKMLPLPVLTRKQCTGAQSLKESWIFGNNQDVMTALVNPPKPKTKGGNIKIPYEQYLNGFVDLLEL